MEKQELKTTNDIYKDYSETEIKAIFDRAYDLMINGVNAFDAYDALVKDGVEKDTAKSIVDHIENNVIHNNNEYPYCDVDNTAMFSRPFSFSKGRIRRLEYCLSTLIYIAYYIVITFCLLDTFNYYSCDYSFNIIEFVLMIPAFWFIFAQGAKRCHDLGRSGWMQLVPFYNLYLLFASGEDGNNQYGNDPKGEKSN